MALPVYRSYTTTGEKEPWNADWIVAPFLVSVTTVIVSGAAQYAIQYCIDDLNNTAVTPRWIDTTDAPAGTSTTKTITLTSPIRFLRINIAVITGTVELKIIQPMSIN